MACLGRINDLPCRSRSPQSPVWWPEPRELSRNARRQLRFADLIALLEERQIRVGRPSLPLRGSQP